MNKKIIFTTLAVLLIVIAAGLFYKESKNHKSNIHDIVYVEDEIEITTPYAFATTPNAKTAAAFLTINNASEQDNALVAVDSDIAEHNEIHQTYIDLDDGTMMMRKIKKLNTPKGKTTLEPKGYHVMFINLKNKLSVDDQFPVTLTFEDGTTKNITVDVVTPGLTPHHHH